jgi:hypothetical protein
MCKAFAREGPVEAVILAMRIDELEGSAFLKSPTTERQLGSDYQPRQFHAASLSLRASVNAVPG